jgi:hypothetical protein
MDAVDTSRATATASPNLQVHATGWTFDVLSMLHARVSTVMVSTVTSTPYGVFTSREECEIARAKKVGELDDGHARQPHLLPNQPVYTTTIVDARGTKSITEEKPGGATETMSVTDCRDQAFSVRRTAQP